jgi:signal transduction histidine kinase/ActR/RegA family two-component response regulator
MLAVVFFLTAAVLALVEVQMRIHVRADLLSTLQAQSALYRGIEQVRREQEQQTAGLIANQPSLKALMSTNDRATVQDASASILETSHADLLILENASGAMLALHSRTGDLPLPAVERLLEDSTGPEDWWVAGGRLYHVSFAPILAGAPRQQHRRGRITLGREISAQSVVGAGVFGSSTFTFERQGSVLLSSLPVGEWNQFERSLFERSLPSPSAQAQPIQEMTIAGERYLALFVELPGDHPVRFYSLQSYDQATSFLGILKRKLLTLGAAAVVLGAFLAAFVSRQITRPLERLAFSTRQLEKGDFEFQLPIAGADEVADLTRSFEEMRKGLRQSRESLVRSARLEAVGRLAGGVAHDFNNLVMIIRGYSDLLLDSATAESRPYLEEIKQAGDRASGLTRQLLAFSRKQVLETQVLDPNQSVRNMAKMLRVLIGEDIELLTNFSDQTGRVQADPGQLEQVVMNLAVNARDAMPKGGKLIIETQTCQLDAAYAATHPELTPGPYILLAVTDTGSGMSKDILEQVFEPFFTTKGPGKGTGLGLATVYGIVKQSRGHISVYSEPGIGTTFKIYLPSVEKPVAELTPPPGRLPAKGQGTVLLVEDEPALRRLAGESLKRLGYQVLQAGNGLEALKVAEQHPGRIDIVVTDIVMPRMGGPELVENLKQKRDPMGVIFMSGYTETAVLENASLGADAVLLNKPFSTELLASKISELQGRKGENHAFSASGSG